MGGNDKYYFALTSGIVTSVVDNIVSVDIMFDNEGTLSDISYIPDTGSMIIVYSEFSLSEDDNYIEICFNNQPVRKENVFRINNAISVGYNILYYDSGFFINLSQKTSSVIPITYDNLLSLRDNSLLVPGNKYRIIDYVSVFDSANIFGTDRFVVSGGHRFDIIVTAISNTEFDSEANAVYNDSDEYFANSDLSAWKLKYTINNSIGCIDISRPKYAGFTYSRNDYFHTGYRTTYNGESYYEYQNSSGTVYYLKSDTPCFLPNKDIFRRNGSSFVKASTFTKCWNGNPIGKGIIYSMEDEFGNRCPYDFKNLISYKIGGTDGHYTFDSNIDYPRDQSLSGIVYNNVIGPNLTSGNQYKTNKIILLGECCNNVFGNDAYNITLNNSSYNRFGDRCNNITLKYPDGRPVSNLTYNSFGNGCSSLTITFADGNTSSYRYIECDCGMQGTLDMTAFNTNNDYTTIITKRPSGEIIYASIAELIGMMNDSVTELMLNRTHSEMVSLVDTSELIPGMKYRITDYVTTTSVMDTTSNQKQFDIIVTATSNNTLNEDAFVMHHKGDTYFENSDLSKWRIKYSLSNDTSRFRWAKSDGTGVIYYMKDEFGNEAPYDFKNIMFKVTENSVNYWCYTFNMSRGQGSSDWSMSYTCHHNIIEECFDSGTYVRKLNNVIFNSNNSMSICEFNTIGQNSYDIKFNVKNLSSPNEASFTRNKIGKRCYNISFGYISCEGNVIGDGSNGLSFGNNVLENVVGSYCVGSTFLDNAANNIIGNRTSNVILGRSASFNVIGDKCSEITIGTNGNHNNIGSSSVNIVMSKDQCQYNVFGDTCSNITMGNNSSYNTFGENCYNIKAGAFFQLNTFADYCNNIVFSKMQVSSMSAVSNSNLRDYCQNNTFAKESYNMCIYKDCTSCLANRINNLNVVFPRRSTETTFVPIEIETLNINYELFVRRNTDGVVKIFNLADLVIE
jgi:hypothetical protein